MILALIKNLDVEVTYTDRLPAAWHGAYWDDERRIFIRSGLTAPYEEQALWHEYAHAWHRDRGHHPTTEWRAWRFAARMIVDPLKYASAERLSTSSVFIASELGTTTRIIEAYRHAIVRGELYAQAA